MFGTIIIGVDGQQGGRDALALGSVLGHATGSELVAACTFPYESMPSRAANPAYRNAMMGESRDVLTRDLSATGVDARAVVVQDMSVARGLHRLAEKEHAGLIVIGSPHHGKIGTMVLGNVTHNTLSAAPCAVAVAPKDFASRRLVTIGVGFDGTPEARRALELAAGLARESGARLQVVSAVDAPHTLSMHKSYMDADYLRGRAHEEAQEALDEALRDVDVDHSGDVVDGSPATVLGELSGRVDLLVLGSRNWGPVRRLMVGSTSHAVVAHAQSAVLVLPRGPETGEPAETLETEEVAQPTA